MKRIRWISVFLLCLWLWTVGAAAVQAEETEALPPPWENKEMLLSGVCEADIPSLRRALDLGWLTCEELTACYLERIEAYNSTYNCFITLCDDALETARARDAELQAGTAKGALFGIPVVVKDNIDVAGLHTTNGHVKEDSQIAEENAEIVEYLLREGAVILGKSNMSTDAEDAYITWSDEVGETHNVYDVTMSSGGSSGGSAAAVSLNFAAAGLGTDTNSSLRYPAVLNGCVSMRTTFGALSREGITLLNDTRDVPGVITRTVTDQAIMLDVLSGGKTHYAENLDADALSGLRLGVLDELTYAVAGRAESAIDPEITEAFEEALKVFEACGAEIVHIEPQGLIDLCAKTMESNAEELKENVDKAFRAALEEYSVSAVLYPAYVTAPLHSGEDENGVDWDPYSQPYINNCRLLSPSSGTPEITVPLGVHSEGAGMGMEICAPENEEQLLLNIAYAYTLQDDRREMPADAKDLYGAYNVGTLGDILEDYDAAQQAAAALETTPDGENQPQVQNTEKNSGKAPASAGWILPVCSGAAVICAIAVFLCIAKKKAGHGRHIRPKTEPLMPESPEDEDAEEEE